MDKRTLRCKLEYEGNVYPSSYGDFKVIEFKSKTKVLIEFIKTSYRKITTLGQIRVGKVKDPYFPAICDIGFVGEGPYPITYSRNGKRKSTPAYEVWRGKLRNCYDTTKFSYLYHDVNFNEDWLNYQVFAKWYYEQVKLYGKGGVVDKDLLFLGSREYSEHSCAYIPQAVNSLFGGTSNNISGVYFDETKMLWCSQVHVGLTNARGERYQSYLGGYSNKSDAIAAYKSSKISHIKNTALEFQEKIPAILFYKLYLGA